MSTVIHERGGWGPNILKIPLSLFMDGFCSKMFTKGQFINYIERNLRILTPPLVAEKGLPLPNRKLYVPRSECFTIVWENQIGFFSP